MARVHHSAIVVRDVDASLRFWRDGIGLAVMMDRSFDGDWPALFDAPGSTLRSVFLGDPDAADAGVVELVSFGPEAREPVVAGPAPGFFLLSLYLDVEAALERLAALGLGGPPRRITVAGPRGAVVPMATVRDPDGVLVELIGQP
jgi:glyoxylase I family protein